MIKSWMAPEHISVLNKRSGPNHSALGDYCDILLGRARLTSRWRQFVLAADCGMTVEQVRCQAHMRKELRRYVRASTSHSELAHLALGTTSSEAATRQLLYR